MRALVPLCAAMLLLSGCAAETQQNRDAFYHQQIRWSPCSDSNNPDWFQDTPPAGSTCARILAPLDYRNTGASAKKVSIPIARLPAKAAKHGTLVLISGGPGDPGLSMLDMPFPEPIRQHYDIVSYDPRGVGQSTPAIRCVSNGDELTEEPVTAAAMEAASRVFVDACVRATGSEILRHIGSDEATDDLDIIRGVLGEQRLNLLAMSYGTQIAAMYIDRYPRRYRAAALDGVVDVTENSVEMRAGQYRGHQDTFDRVAAYCATSYREGGRFPCPLGNDPAQAQNVFHNILRTVEKGPAPTDAWDPVGPDTILAALAASFPWPQNWTAFLNALTAVRYGDGTAMYRLAYRDSGAPRSGALEAITCADIADPTTDRATAQADAAKIYDAATYDDYQPRPAEFPLDTCAFWPTAGTARTYRPHRAKDSAPVLFIGTRHDPATPVQNAERMAQYLESPLLIREGDGHTFVFNEINRCGDDFVVHYLEHPEVAGTKVCE
ncbi:alpha/beta hydrolase [Nocardia pseudobrasiliensis]|uniref:Alpha/beta hydrolase family protein n=1 Tax=Nocardia pseudobrasiliensis TaxID=45979 RepID=A0A370I130_9NOCA|nr:alpha/beta hydrolase [Nocardia pseudobrasiliensis]RDI63891.1 alpha/beta hydrolase family protein [Nocardia pseudobrasiliensis]